MVSDEELRNKAKKRAKGKVAFYIHFTIYLLVNLLLYSIWWTTLGPSTYPWPIWTTIGWGIGIIAHFIGAFVGTDFQEKLTEKEYQKLKKNK